jgi:xanthine dehydrogenase accessory factor
MRDTIFGGGHISLPLARIGKMVGFRVIVIDDRPEFANRERFPEADEIFAQDFSLVYPQLQINKSSYIVIVTRGHLSDETVLEWAVGTEAAYIGMIGSEKKVNTIFSHLQSKGTPREVLEKVHAPIGLDIHAETPEEIAISILAEVIKVKRTSHP